MEESKVIERQLDNLGRRHFEIAGHSYTEIRYEPFKMWVTEKYGDYNSFLKLKFNDKRKIFLKWKWHSKSDESNEACESTERYILHVIKNHIYTHPSWKLWQKEKKEFAIYCCDIQKEIGILD